MVTRMTTVTMRATTMDTLIEQKYVTLTPISPSSVKATYGQLHKGVLPTFHTAHYVPFLFSFCVLPRLNNSKPWPTHELLLKP